jgi:hypothetical protein
MDASLSVRRVTTALLLATAVLFVVGVVLERGDEHHAGGTGQSEASEHRGDSEPERGGELAAHNEAGESNEARVLGIDAEATPLVFAAVLVSIALAALVWFSDSTALLGIVAIVAVVFAVFDIAEVFHQIDESRIGLAIMAALVAAGHATIAVLGATAFLRARHTPSRA